MSTLLKKLFENEKNIKLNAFNIFLTVLGIVFIRTFLENFSSPHISGMFFPPYALFIHYTYFYFSIIFSIVIFLKLFTKITLNDSFLLGLRVFPIVWLPPIIDLLITNGKGWKMAYLFVSPTILIKDFFTFFGEFKSAGSTPGMRIEIFIVLLLTYLFVFYKTSSKIKATLGTLYSYIILFIHLSFPSFLMPFYKDVFSNTFLFLDKIYTKSLFESQQMFGPTITSQDYIMVLEQSFNVFISRIFWIVIFFQLLIILFLYSKKTFFAWIKNSRWERILYYFAIAILGIGIYLQTTNTILIFNFTNILALIVFFILIATNFWLAVIINDFADVDIDTVSNSNRPLIAKDISEKELIVIGSILGIFILCGLLLLNYLTLIFLLFFQFNYFVYSSQPLHLKNNFLTASAILGLNALLIAMSAFFLVSPDQHLAAFPIKFIWLIFIGFFLISNIKDIKDYAGDKIAKIYTLPVLLGEAKSKIAISLSCSIFLIIFPIFIKKDSILMISTISSILLIYFINKKSYKEYPIFLLFFIYTASIMFFF